VKNNQRGSATLIIVLGIVALAGGMGVTVISSSVLQNRAQARVIDSEESFYSGEITALQIYERKRGGLVATPGEFTVTIDNRNNISTIGAAAPAYDPGAYIAGVALPLSVTTQFDPAKTILRRYSPTNLTSKYSNTGTIGSTYCGKMKFSGNRLAICLYEREPVTVEITANGSPNPPAVAPGSTVTVAWNSHFAQSCVLTNGITDTTTSGTANVPDIATFTTFSVTCSRPGGQLTDTATAVVNVPVLAAPLTCDLKANGNDGPLTLSTGEQASLSWTASDPLATCSVSPGGQTGNPGAALGATIVVAQDHTLNCTRPGGLATDTCTDLVQITPVAAPFTADIQANGADGPVNVTSGGQVTLTWKTSRPTSANCTVNPGGFTGAESSGQLSPAITSPTDFVLNCTSGTDTAQDIVHVNPTGVLPLTADLKVNNSDTTVTLPSGTAAQLNWTSTPPGATCSVNPGGYGGPSGSVASSPLDENTTFVLQCSSPDGQTASDQVAVKIQPALPTADLKANGSDAPSPVNWEGTVLLSWASTNATSCTVTSNRTPSNTFSGTSNAGVTSAALTGATTYTLTCTGPAGIASDTVCIGTKSAPPISFEDNSPYAGKQISTQWQSTHHVTFSILGSSLLPVLAQVARPGEKVEDPRAWICAKCPGNKARNRLWDESQYLLAGSWTLTLPDATHNANPKPLLVTYEFPVSEVTGYVADIDDEEVWTITALGPNNVPFSDSVWTKTSPKGYGPGTWNGEMVPFKITRPRAEIHALVIDGAKGRKFFGFGFDAFSAGDSFCAAP